MTFIKVGTSCNLTGSRQGDLYLTDKLIIAKARESVKKTYSAVKVDMKGGD